ncbi:hypothetical protein FPOAC2_14622 [Fusarium poae]
MQGVSRKKPTYPTTTNEQPHVGTTDVGTQRSRNDSSQGLVVPRTITTVYTFI